ncbi:MAG: hypothetical protein QOG13_2686 [Sphingomonadales bacterium]|jgi:uncharacterized protein YlxP (DUF503 family)|nr:hypothetical protein [Sphingomonadales bacterium]
MFEKLRSYRLVEELETNFRLSAARSTDRDRRAAIPIAVIDDEQFKPEHNLKNVGYNITFLGDIKDIREVTEYNIILCDLQGVGRHIDNRKQGAFIIDEIKRNHPEKFVLAYTGGSLDDQITVQAQLYADYFIRKDADMDEWRDKLDEVIGVLANPIEVWRRQRVAMIAADVNTLDILKLEDAYVRAIQASDVTKYVNFVREAPLGSDVRAIANSLIASGVFKVLVG